MIRLVNISREDNVLADSPCFAWYDTTTDTFLEYSGSQVWKTWDDFAEDCEGEIGAKSELGRFRRLFPPSVDTPRAETIPSAIDPVRYEQLREARYDEECAKAMRCTCSSHCLQVEGCCCARGKAIKLTRNRIEELLRLL